MEFSARVFFFYSCWQILKDITRLMIMIQVKLLTLFRFVVGVFVSISFRELILTSWKPVRIAAFCTVTWACQRNSLCGWTHVRCAVGEFLIWWLNWLPCWNWRHEILSGTACLCIFIARSWLLAFSDVDFVKYFSGGDSEGLVTFLFCS